MTYSEFKDYLIEYLWKRGDSVVLDRLDSIIKTAEAELNRVFKVEDRTQYSSAMATSDLVPLPLDYREMRTLANAQFPSMTYYVPSLFLAEKVKSSGNRYDIYTTFNRFIGLIGNYTEENPLELSLVYYRTIPHFQAENSSWLVENYLDVYTYCVLKHTAPFLREDERITTWAQYFNSAISTAMEENAEIKFSGSPLQIQFPAGVR